MMRCMAALLLIFTMSALAAEPTLRQLLENAETLAANKQWAAAEAEAQEAVRRFPQSREARLRLAQVVLWSGDYRRARPMFARLVEQQAEDVEARLGLAQAAYWSGDYRGALREFDAILRVRPDNAEARRGAGEIRSAARPGYALDAGGISDDQPYRSTTGGARVYFFSDPLTKWEVGSAATSLRADGASRRLREIFAAGETALPRAGLRMRAGARWLRFPDGRGKLLPLLSVEQTVGQSHVVLAVERRELLRTSSALRSHPFADVAGVRWSREREGGPRFSVSAESLRYFDGNRSTSADAYALIPAGAFSFGGSAAWKDTREPRFRADTGEYDPYWTPHRLREARAIAAAALKRGVLTVDLHLDGGIARDRVLYSGTETPSFSRTFHPWRAALGAGAPLGSRATLHLSAARVSSVFYTANEIQASVVGRF